MLHSLTLENHRSIRTAQTLDFRVPKSAPDRPTFHAVAPDPFPRVCSVNVLVGPNAAGKSNFLTALASLTAFLQTGSDADVVPGHTRQLFPHFATHEAEKGQTIVRVQFDAPMDMPEEPDTGLPPTALQYELSIHPATKEIPFQLHETLTALRPSGSKTISTPILARTGTKPLRVHDIFEIPAKHADRAPAPTEVSALTVLAERRNETAQAIVNYLRACFRTSYHEHDVQEDNLSSLGLGIAKRSLPLNGHADSDLTPRLQHAGLDQPVSYMDESAGTRQLDRIMPAVRHALKHGSILAVPHIFRDVHFSIANTIIEYFTNPVRNPRNAQLIFSTHSPVLLHNMDKEQLHVIRKDENGCTTSKRGIHIHGVRRSGSLTTYHYQGVFGDHPPFVCS